jgi:methionyl aminopeptidase
MIFTIEPMINQGQPHVSILQDGWTVVTKDHSLSAQWEHTVLVTEKGYEVLTQSKFETDPNNQHLASDMPVT